MVDDEEVEALFQDYAYLYEGCPCCQYEFEYFRDGWHEDEAIEHYLATGMFLPVNAPVPQDRPVESVYLTLKALKE